MLKTKTATHSIIEHHIIKSIHLEREVKVDCYLPCNVKNPAQMSLLLVNDGQDLVTMNFSEIINKLYHENSITPILCIAMHCGVDRKQEYGTARISDYLGRGSKSALHQRFVFEEVLPMIKKTYHIPQVKEIAYAGFSLGGLSAMDMVWHHPEVFSKVGVFSGSFWWRDKAQEDPDFDENKHRIMHRQIREGKHQPGMKFFFEVGTKDETADRNNNGIIDAIDDTISLIEELKIKGYTDSDIFYLELEDGKHDVPTWAQSFPDFLKWGWPKH